MATFILGNLVRSDDRSSTIEEIFAGTTVDIEKVKEFFLFIPTYRFTYTDNEDYIRKAAMDDIFKSLLNHIKGHYQTPYAIVSCIAKNNVFAPQYLLDYIEWCLHFITEKIISNGWLKLLPYVEETQTVLQPILSELIEKTHEYEER